ncbi:MAG: hypothetical protein HZB19_01400 [Chloroflexi bacterium]|nr:hypothetical protein [Chloroflexota bacterium]
MMFFSRRKPWVLMAVMFALMIGLVPLFLSSSGGGSSGLGGFDYQNLVRDFEPRPSDETLQGKEIVRIGVYILSVGSLDTTNGTYSVDFFLNFICETSNCDPSDFDIMNAASEPEVVDQTANAVRGREFYYRIRADLQTNLDLRNFPFDNHILGIEFEDKNKANDKYVFIADPDLSGIDSQVYVAGWNLDPYILGRASSHEYQIYKESYSRARFAIHIDHPWSSSFMKGLFAAIVIVGVGMLSFLMNPAEAQDRIALTSGTLASAIFYHMTLTSSIPPVGYLTYADRFMILQYIFITASLAVAVTLFLLLSAEKRGANYRKIAGQIHQATRWTIPLLWVIAMIVLHYLTIGFTPLI